MKKNENSVIQLKLQTVTVITLLDVVRLVFKNQILEKGIHLDIKGYNKLMLINVDVSKILWVITSIVSNSLRYTLRWGQIMITLKKEADQIILIIEDNGSGIKQEKLENLFSSDVHDDLSPDYLANQSISLELVKEIMEAHHGSLKITSKENSGTKVFLTFPLVL